MEGGGKGKRWKIMNERERERERRELKRIFQIR